MHTIKRSIIAFGRCTANKNDTDLFKFFTSYLAKFRF